MRAVLPNIGSAHVVGEVRDGKQVWLNWTFDRLTMLEQLGLV
jgi:hypothetical protein